MPAKQNPSFVSDSADWGAPLIGGEGARDYYRIGYFDCARNAADNLRRRRGQNRSAMPVLYLYRHYLGAALKDALQASQAFDLDQSEKKFGHDLNALWAEAKRVLTAFVDAEWLAEMDQIVNDFDTLDKKGDAFRYPVNNKGANQFENHGHVLLDELMKRMDDAKVVIEHAISEFRRQERILDRMIEEAVEKDPY
jgi:hypothetical protein